MKSYFDLMGEKWRTFSVAAILMSVLLMGCQSPPRYPSGSEAPPPSSPQVTLVAGDVIEVKFFYTPQLDELQTVRPDGKIALQLVGEVDTQGITPSGLQNKLLELYAPYLEDPEIAVIIQSFQNRRVFVGGKVMTPTVVEMPGSITLLEAIMQAGGFDMQEAEIRNIIVIRHKKDKRFGYSLNLEPMMKGGVIEPFYLEPQDIVYVPRTEIVKAGQWVDQHINKIIPKTGFHYSTPSGAGTIGIDTSSR